jgi:hypothetical protein
MDGDGQCQKENRKEWSGADHSKVNTYVDQERIHISGLFLVPTVWVENVAILTEYLRVAVDDPGIHA